MTIQNLYDHLKSKILKDVEQACKIFGGSVTSWGRSVIRNLQLGGFVTSWHLDWLAFDIILDSELNSSAFCEYLRNRDYRVLDTGSKSGREFHVQYAWPVIDDFVRIDYLSHLRVMVHRMPQLFTEYGEIGL